MIVSPAKSLNFDATLPTKNTAKPFFKRSGTINKLLKKKSVRSLGNSEDFGEPFKLIWQRNQDFQLPFSPKNARLAVYALTEMYTGLDAYSLKEEQLPLLQEKLRILYLLRPFKAIDLIQAYRLEMGTKCLLSEENFLLFER